MPDTKPGTYLTSDLGSAAFMHSRGLELKGVDRGERETVFSFADPRSEAGKLELAWANSVERKYDASLRTLKKLAFGDRDRRR